MSRKSLVLTQIVTLMVLSLAALLWLTLLAGNAAQAPASSGPQRPDEASAQTALEPAGHFGGWLTAIAVPPAVGNHIYLGEGAGLTVYDVADKAHPRQVAGLPLTGEFINGIALANRSAYVINNAGLRVISLADPLRPALLGALGLTDARGSAAAGNTVYIAGGAAGLRIVDVSNPLSPTLAGAYDTPGYANKVAVAGSLAYVADNASGLQIFNVSNPRNPTLVGAYDTPGYARDVQVVGAPSTDSGQVSAYIADDYNGLVILDVSDPAHPTRLGFYDTPGQAWAVAVAGANAYVADGELQILDVSNPANPALLATVSGEWQADNVALSGSHAYVATASKGLRVLNVSNPAGPAVVGVYERPDAVYDMVGGADQVPGTSRAGASRYAYALSETALWTLDLSEPAVPRPLGKAALSGSGIRARVAAAGTLAYVAERSAGLELFDATDPSRPTAAGRYALPDGAYAHDVGVRGAYACLAAASGGAAPGTDGSLHIVDVSNPASPALAASFDTPGDARGVVVAPHASTNKVIAYVADGPAGLRLVDVSNPRAPVALGFVAPPAGTTTVAAFVAGPSAGSGQAYAYVGSNAASGWRLQKVDVSNPVSPAVVAETRAETGKINDLTGDGSRLYIGGSLYVITQGNLAVLHYLGIPVENVEIEVEGNTVTLHLILTSYGSDTWKYAEPEPTPTPTAAPTHTPTTELTRTPTSPPPTHTPTVTPSAPPSPRCGPGWMQTACCTSSCRGPPTPRSRPRMATCWSMASRWGIRRPRRRTSKG